MEPIELSCPDCGSTELVTHRTEFVRVATVLDFYRRDDGSIDDVERTELDRELLDSERGDAIVCSDCGSEFFDTDQLDNPNDEQENEDA
jgi:hypothetical protein